MPYKDYEQHKAYMRAYHKEKALVEREVKRAYQEMDHEVLALRLLNEV